jgi:hypothetical protein
MMVALGPDGVLAGALAIGVPPVMPRAGTGGGCGNSANRDDTYRCEHQCDAETN